MHNNTTNRMGKAPNGSSNAHSNSPRSEALIASEMKRKKLQDMVLRMENLEITLQRMPLDRVQFMASQLLVNVTGPESRDKTGIIQRILKKRAELRGRSTSEPPTHSPPAVPHSIHSDRSKAPSNTVTSDNDAQNSRRIAKSSNENFSGKVTPITRSIKSSGNLPIASIPKTDSKTEGIRKLSSQYNTLFNALGKASEEEKQQRQKKSTQPKKPPRNQHKRTMTEPDSLRNVYLDALPPPPGAKKKDSGGFPVRPSPRDSYERKQRAARRRSRSLGTPSPSIDLRKARNTGPRNTVKERPKTSRRQVPKGFNTVRGPGEERRRKHKGTATRGQHVGSRRNIVF